MILTTEKLDVVVVLVEVEIEVAAALRAFQQAGEYAGFLRDRGLFAACPFLERLHLFPSLAVNDSFMDIEKDRPVFLRVVVGGIDHAIGGKAGGCFCQPVPLKRHTVDPALLGNVLGVILLYFLHSVHVWVGEQNGGTAGIGSRGWLLWDKLSQGAGI